MTQHKASLHNIDKVKISKKTQDSTGGVVKVQLFALDEDGKRVSDIAMYGSRDEESGKKTITLEVTE